MKRVLLYLFILLSSSCISRRIQIESFHIFNNSNIATVIDSLDRMCLKNKIQLSLYNVVYAENERYAMVIYKYKMNNDSICYFDTDMYFAIKKTRNPTSNFYDYYKDTLSLNYKTAKKEFLKSEFCTDFYQAISYDTLGNNYIEFILADTILSGVQPVYIFKDNKKGKLVATEYDVKSLNHKTKQFR